MRVLRVSHSAVVDAWRERERELRRQGLDVALLCAAVWDEGGRDVPLVARPGEDVTGARTWGTHPALFVYDPRPLWRALRTDHEVLDIHEEPFALATAEVLVLARLRRVVDRLRGRPSPARPFVVYSAQNLTKRYPVPFRWVERAVLRRAAAVQVCNDEAGRILRAKGARGRIETIPLGVDLAAFSPARRSPGARPTVGYAGRLAAHKGVDVLLDALAQCPGTDLVVAGAGPEEEALRRRAEVVAPGRVTFHGPLDGDDLVELYRSVDVLAVPSRDTPGWVEQFGRVVVEAMACGTPVVASRSGALPDLVEGAGLLVPPDDATALAGALRRVLDDDGLAARLSRRGAERAAQCSWPAVATRLHELYRDVASTGPATVEAPSVAVPAEPPEVLVVAYGSPELLRRALAPIAGRLPITVVDNSRDERVREITASAHGRYLDPGRNGGFAAGVNHGIAHRQHPGRDVLLLNPDAVVDETGIHTLHRALRAHERTASVGPRQVDGDGEPAQVEWPFPRPWAAWSEALGVDAARRLLGRTGRRRPGNTYVIGSVLLLRAEALDDVGPLDEGFFLYAEETDWAFRAHRRGWHHRLVPEVLAVHLGAATSDDPARRDAWVRASQERYWRKHYGTAGWATARAGGVVGAAARTVLGPRRDVARRRLRLLVHGAAA
ncbi:hypothetical protein GCM10009718_27180 [Isoptericola halotolerans]|uniref:D-inositol 3-phosphate glycosyltransferase n=1 Tax=Isoptericola halotolerans TaxID=300560 RepID=A0ABX2A6A8_9MICO|nr:glycosyltransferase [Isoptericola halotolerans]NOV97430.1 glycosyltransferase involved in cell wall biosynthesis/GT2 family glycosyltransferase [Isoptericola halotolerans]